MTELEKYILRNKIDEYLNPYLKWSEKKKEYTFNTAMIKRDFAKAHLESKFHSEWFVNNFRDYFLEFPDDFASIYKLHYGKPLCIKGKAIETI